MDDKRCESFNAGYDAHDDGLPRESYGDDVIVSYYVEGWDVACHYAGHGDYEALCEEQFHRCPDHFYLESVTS